MPLMNMSEYGRHRKALGLPGGNPVAVGKAIYAGRITFARKGLVDSEQADKDWLKNTNPLASAAGVIAGAVRAKEIISGEKPSRPRLDPSKAKPKPRKERPQIIDYNVSRAAREHFESELARIKLAEKEKELIPATVVRKILYECGRIIRAGHDNTILQLSPDLAAETSIDLVEKMLRESLERLDNQLADKILNLQANDIGLDEEELPPEEDQQVVYD